MSRKITPEGQRLNVVAMAWWRYWRTVDAPTDFLTFVTDPSTVDLIKACADLDAAQNRVFIREICPPDCELRDVRHVHGARLYEPLPLQHGAQGEELDGDTGTGGVEQQ